MNYPLRLPSNDPILTLTKRNLDHSTIYDTKADLAIAKSSLWIIELHNGEDNRLTQTLVDQAFKPALDIVERHWRKQWRTAKRAMDKPEEGGGALIIVGKRSQNKFFSNGRLYCVTPSDARSNASSSGLDFPSVAKNPNFVPSTRP